MTDRKIAAFEVFDHGVDHAQYFQGHGTSFTDWEDCATGCGETAAAALEDALENLAQGEWDTAPIKVRGLLSNPRGSVASFVRRNEGPSAARRYLRGEIEECELHYYVSISVRGDDSAE